MPIFEVEVNAEVTITLDSATITIEADSYEDAQTIVGDQSWTLDDLGLSSSEYWDTVNIDWVDCAECGVRDSDEHSEDCSSYEDDDEEADEDLEEMLGV